ncbi:unnamed protein product [Trifolium pratense]|uniref:Uncharacterized protein n=1 Tax=Trifolium pratense TaxID=57577 RepID=A0ACB0KZV5_TRIPR|nr:unnamed protein product [Trifolium pratense]
MPSDIQGKIAAILPPSAVNGCDEPAGVGGNNNEFSVAAMYEHICGFDRRNAQLMWKKTWQLNVTERVRCFVWLLTYDRLLTNSRKSRMGLGHAMCNYCGNVEETTIHVLRDCNLVNKFWLQVVPLEDRNTFFMENLQQWIYSNLSKGAKGRIDSAWCDYWATACHCFWTWRNKEIHDAEFTRPIYAMQHVYRRVNDYYQANKTNRLMRIKNDMLVYISWKPPCGSYVKLNTDGACKDQNRGGCGGIIRGSQGEWLGGFARGLGNCSAIIAELWGVAEGLSYARRLGFTAVELNVDSVVVVQAIKTGRFSSSVGLPLVKHIRRMLDLDWEIKIEHAYRESNKCADAMANIGCHLDRETIFYDSCPIRIKELLLADELGITTPRIISM